MNKPFDLEAFKAGQKALTRYGRVATFVGICDGCTHAQKLFVFIAGHATVRSLLLNGKMYDGEETGVNDLVSMASRHQALIDSYDTEDTWKRKRKGVSFWEVYATGQEPEWAEETYYELHKHNDLIKAWKRGAKIESYICGEWIEEPTLDWYEDTKYRIKPEPSIHCLVYDTKRFDFEQTTAVRARVVKKEVAEANGWKIIQEWEV